MNILISDEIGVERYVERLDYLFDKVTKQQVRLNGIVDDNTVEIMNSNGTHVIGLRSKHQVQSYRIYKKPS